MSNPTPGGTAPSPADIEDLPPGALHRGLAYLGIPDDVPPLTRGSKPWWVRNAVFAIALLVMMGLVAVGG